MSVRRQHWDAGGCGTRLGRALRLRLDRNGEARKHDFPSWFESARSPIDALLVDEQQRTVIVRLYSHNIARMDPDNP